MLIKLIKKENVTMYYTKSPEGGQGSWLGNFN